MRAKRIENQGNEKIIIGGFEFADEKSAFEAKRELEGIEYVAGRANFESPEAALSVYDKIIEKKLFKTPVGYSYLYEVQKYLKSSGVVDQSRIVAIPADMASEEEKKDIYQNDSADCYRKRYRFSLYLNVIMIFIIIAMFYITLTGENLNIINYKNHLTDKYAEWDQELTEREAAVRSLEQKYEGQSPE